jgi:6-phosphogluconolactonase
MRLGRALPFAAAAALAVSFTMSEARSSTFVYVGNADSQDLSVFELLSDGKLLWHGTFVVQNPARPGRSMLLAVSPDRKTLYAAYFVSASHSSVATFSIGPNGGLLTLVGNTQLADAMSYIATDRSGRYLFSASYSGSKVTVNAIGPTGVVAEIRQIIETEPKAHCVLADSSNRHVLHTALGGDVIYQDAFDADTGKLAPGEPPTMSVNAGAGPRFLAFSPDEKFVYVINELDGSIYVFPYDPATGILQKETQIASALPLGFSGQPWAADIHLTPDARFLYASERTSSTLAAFQVDSSSGALTFIESVPTLKQPRAFGIDPSGSFLLASGQLSNSVMSYSIDKASGRLTSLGEYPVGKNPTWVEFVRLP